MLTSFCNRSKCYKRKKDTYDPCDDEDNPENVNRCDIDMPQSELESESSHQNEQDVTSLRLCALSCTVRQSEESTSQSSAYDLMNLHHVRTEIVESPARNFEMKRVEDGRNFPPNKSREKDPRSRNSRYCIYNSIKVPLQKNSYSRNRPNNNLAFISAPLLFISCLFVSFFLVSQVSAVSTAIATTNSTDVFSVPQRKVCGSLDIRNSVESFRQLTDCSVIEGFLQIVLMDRTNESHFANLSFPHLREITGYLLLYRVKGLRSLSKLFPNLSVIRGHHLFINYALAVYEMLHLEEIGLYSLVDIPRGAVFITKNPMLCYIDTIDWNRIVTSGRELNLIFDNRQSNACPKCPTFPENSYCAVSNITKQPLCWNANHCQRACSHCSSNRCSADGVCCSDYCLGGCTGSNNNECFACKHILLENANRCVTTCPSEYYEYKDRRCITAEQCYNMTKPPSDTYTASQMQQHQYKLFNGSCIYECPPGYEEVEFFEDGEKRYRCKLCGGTCRKVCDGGANVDSIQSAQRLKGCVVINGSLEIQVRGGGNIVKELEDSLNTVEEITGYLKVVRSLSLVSLNFLRRLRVIRGEYLESGKYALIVLDNQNLAELWDFEARRNQTDDDKKIFQILRGRIFFHFNPKLCLDKIKTLQDIVGLKDVDELDVARNSNGDKVACNLTELHVWEAKITNNMCILTWKPYTHFEMRTLLGYVIYIMEAPDRNVTMNDGRDACGGDGWKVYDVEVPDSSSPENMTQIIPHLKPYTLYAYYVKTYTIATETNGAQSKIQYFKTNPSIPTPPRQLKITAYSSSEVYVEWHPPEQANGNLTQYIILGEVSDGQHLLEQRDYCKEPIEFEKKEPVFVKDEAKKKQSPTVEKKQEECTCPVTEGQSRIKKTDQEVQALIEFENKLHDSIYVKSTSVRNRREISNIRELFAKNNHVSKTMYMSSNEGATTSTAAPRNASEPVNKTTPSTVEQSLSNFTDKAGTKFRYVVPSTQHSILISNLRHFTEYSINVQACRQKIENDPVNACSADKMASVKTHPLESADRIDPGSIEIEVLNGSDGSVRLKWAEPIITNGPILTYHIKYKRMEVENQQPNWECITSSEFLRNGRTYILRNLHPGNYSLSLKAASLAKDTGNTYTPAVYFYVNESNAAVIHQLILGALFAMFLVVLVVIIMLTTLRYFYPDTWYQRKLMFASVNPEYFKPIEGFLFLLGYDQWEVPRRKIQFESLLGIGHFGEVYEGRAKGIIEKGITTKVAIKTLSKAPNNHKSWVNFLNEASVMKQFDTHHVVRLLGVVTKGEPLVIMELMSRGDLRTYLRSCREDIPDEDRRAPLQPPPTLMEILQMAAEIADGMLYLADKKFVHRDLAARNCMINEMGTVKIGDFGLTRDVYETDYYRKDSKGHLPVRWMAPESLRDGIFTSRSDVWSYGVVLWEMATLASLPYAGLGNGEVMPFVINGGVMQEPENCPEILSRMMRLCWQYKYSERPSFSGILDMLLPHLGEDFIAISYYHSPAAIQLRASHTDPNSEDDTPYTPLRKMEEFEDFSDSDDEDVDDILKRMHKNGHARGLSASTPSIAIQPIANGYVKHAKQHRSLINLRGSIAHR